MNGGYHFQLSHCITYSFISCIVYFSIIWHSGVLGIIWFVFWLYLAYDSPAKHPRVSKAERLHIESTIEDEGSDKIVEKVHNIVILILIPYHYMSLVFHLTDSCIVVVFPHQSSRYHGSIYQHPLQYGRLWLPLYAIHGVFILS